MYEWVISFCCLLTDWYSFHIAKRQLIMQSFVLTTFYRLDVGDGKDLDLKQCSRSKLQQQCIKYLGPVCIECSAICCIIDEIVKDPWAFTSLTFNSILLFLELAREGALWIRNCPRGNNSQTNQRSPRYNRMVRRDHGDICLEYLQESLYWSGKRSKKPKFNCFLTSSSYFQSFDMTNILSTPCRKRKECSIILASWLGEPHWLLEG